MRRAASQEIYQDIIRSKIHFTDIVITAHGPPLYENCFDIRAMLTYT